MVDLPDISEAANGSVKISSLVQNRISADTDVANGVFCDVC